MCKYYFWLLFLLLFGGAVFVQAGDRVVVVPLIHDSS
jgi:hypothetical protein